MGKSAVLRTILAATEERVAAAKAALPLRDLMDHAARAREPHEFVYPFKKPGVHVIAEIKKKSPSMGAIAADADPVAVAGEYLANGATALSVLTEPKYFNGSLEYLAAIREKYPQARLLMKDFILEEYQIAQARVHGADAILLIAAALDDDRLARLYVFARTLGMAALVEVHDEDEMKRAVALRADFIGVNNRNLKTMNVTLETAFRLQPLAPTGSVLVAESGIVSGAEVARLRTAGYRGFLVGTSLMAGGHPGEALQKLIAEAQ